MDKLVRGETSLQSVIIREGWTLRQFRAELDCHPALRHDTRDWSEAELLTKLAGRPPRRRLVFSRHPSVLRGSSDILVLRQAAQTCAASWSAPGRNAGPDLPYALAVRSADHGQPDRKRNRPMPTGR